MRFNLTIKFFIAFLVTSLTIVVMMVVIMQLYAYRNFLGYIAKMDTLILRELASRLSEEYRKDEGWDNLRNSPDRWMEIARLSFYASVFFKPPPLPTALGSYLPPPPGRFAREDREKDDIMTPQKELLRNDEDGRSGPDKQDLEERKIQQPGLPGDDRLKKQSKYPPFGLEHRLTLFDERMQPVVGPAWPADSQMLQEISVNGKTVGWLGLKKQDRLSNPLDIAFLKQQSKAFYTVGALMLFVAASVAFLLSRHLLAPVQQLIQGTRALTSRRFDTRIMMKTSDELGLLAADFNQMAQTLERYEQMQRQWLLDIAHELRTPLAILQGEIEALQDGVRVANMETLSSLHAESVHISKIVNDLHDLSLAESGALHLRKDPVALFQVLRECLQKFQGRFRDRGISIIDELDSNEECIVTGDRNRLMQVFSNLLENTLRYTDAPGVVTVRPLITSGEVAVQFADSKPGVPPESISRLCDRLYRVDAARSRAQGGSGLGLAICKAIVEAHGGSIRLQNAAAGGLQVDSTFPLRTKKNVSG